MDLAQRIANLSPEQRKLLEARMSREGLAHTTTVQITSQQSTTITPASLQAYYPVSTAQHRLLLVQEIGGASLAYHMPMIVQLYGVLDQQKLTQAFKQLIQRHESLRTSFPQEDGKRVQQIHSLEEIAFEVTYHNSQQKTDAIIDELITAFMVPFIIEKAPLMRVQVIQFNEQEHLLMLDIHHLISDGLSMERLTTEFIQLYSGESLPPLSIQYKDYAVWQQHQLTEGHWKDQEKFWLNTLQGELPVLQLATDFLRPSVQQFDGERFSATLDRSLLRSMKQLAIQQGCTMYMVLLSAYYILLHKYTDQQDLIVGTPVAGRSYSTLQPLIGMFVNTLPLRQYPSGDKAVAAFLQEVKQHVLEAFQYEHYPLEHIVEKIGVPRDISRNPLFDTVFSYQHAQPESIEVQGLQFQPYQNVTRTAKFDLTLIAEESSSADELMIHWDYASHLYDKQTIIAFHDHYLNILQAMVSAPDALIRTIQMLTASEQHELVIDLNRLTATYDREQTIHGLFEQQVLLYPHQKAIVYEDQFMTYTELNEQSNQLAAYLQQQGVVPDHIIAVMPERSLQMVVGILGILKAGAAYLPIDPEYPTARIEFMLKDSQTSLLLTHRHLDKNISFDGSILDLDDASLYQHNYTYIPTKVTSDHVAYVIYTSGTTGTPKGVLVEHHGMANMRLTYEHTFELTSNDRIVQFANLSFDASVWEMYMALFMGGTLYLAPKEKLINIDYFTKWINMHQITVAMLPPNFAVYLEPEQLPSLRLLITGGSESSIELVRRWNPYVDYCNAYGPTEATICVSIWKSVRGAQQDLSGTIPIGEPVWNTHLYVMNSDQQLTPRGIAGELYIGGDVLARGYWQRSDLTAEKFIVHPFLQGERIYRTGDLVRWLPNGQLEYLGRIDHQVKIRGYRIELGEIESKLVNHPQIQEATVIVHELQGEKTMCAYITLADKESIRDQSNISSNQWRQYMQEQLPAYMVPAHIVLLEEFPLTPNGKIDRKALPLPDTEILSSEEYEAPITDTECQLAALWADILGVEPIGRYDHFFERGGHSLKAVVLISQIAKTLGVEISLRHIFEYPVLQDQAHYIESARPALHTSIPRIADQYSYPVSSAQKRLLMIEEIADVGTTYHIPLLLHIQGKPDMVRMNKVFRQLIERHEALRTSFYREGEEYYQKVHDSSLIDWNIEHLEYSNANHLDMTDLLSMFVRPFHRESAPLLRTGLLNLHNDEYILIIDIHHLISDGSSMERLTLEFNQLYAGATLTELPVHYRDYTVWHQQQLQAGLLEEHQSFWLKELEGELPVLNMHTDFPRPVQQRFAGRSFTVQVDVALTDQLRQVGGQHQSTMYMLLLSAYYILLSKYTGQEDIIVGTPVAGRNHADLQGMMGMFVNMLALRNYPIKEQSFSQFLNTVKERTLAAFQHEQMPLELLIEQLNVKRDLSRNPLFDTIFTLQNTGSSSIEVNQLTFTPISIKADTSKFDLSLTIEEEDGLLLHFEYAVHLYEDTTIQQMATQYVELLQQLVNHPHMLLEDMKLISEEQQKSIIVEFNPPYTAYPREATIQELWKHQVIQHANTSAVICGQDIWSYQALEDKSNALAWKLKSLGVTPDMLIGIIPERSPNMIIGILAILKAGGAYVPIDASYPAERIQYMLADSQISIVLTMNDTSDSYRLEFEGVILNLQESTSYDARTDSLPLINQANDLAYVMYTSGSTGQPKGVMIEHRNVIRLVKETDYIQLTPSDRILMTGALVFDACTFEIWGSLLNGLSLCLVPNESILDAEKLHAVLLENKITTMWLTSPLFNQLALQKSDLFQSLRQLIIGGDVLSPKIVARVQQQCPQVTMINGYGPTENTTFSCCYTIPPIVTDQSIPIGRPIMHSTAYIVSESGHVLPPGVPGEIWVGGDGVARGYLNRDDLTAEQFVRNDSISAERMYRTGDLGRWLTDGRIEYLGRIDHQVKIRGYRIEPSEIEKVLLHHDLVNQVYITILTSQDEQKNLCAYIATREPLSNAEIRNYLTGRLPDYMIPSYYVFLSELPLNTNGKVNRQALPQPELNMESVQDYVAPRNEQEHILAQIWADVLDMDKVGIDDRFFECGGHSLKGIQLISKAKEQGISLNIHQLFQHQTIRTLSNLYLHQNDTLHLSVPTKSYKTIDFNVAEQQEITEAQLQQWNEEIRSKNTYWHQYTMQSSTTDVYPIAPVQHHHILHPECSGVVIPLNNEVNVDCLAQAFANVVHRYPLLRSTFIKDQQSWKWQVHDWNIHVEQYGDYLPTLDLLAYPEAQQQTILSFLLPELYMTSYVLEANPLYRVLLVRLQPERHLILFACSHLIFDGMSGDILKAELTREYECAKNNESVAYNQINYDDYTQLILQGPQRMTDEQLNTSFELEKFSFSSQHIQQKTTSSLRNHYSKWEGYFEYEHPETADSFVPMDMLLQLTAKVLGTYFKTNDVPLWLTHYGRQYSEHYFYEQIGECIDQLPIVISTDQALPNMQAILSTVTDHHINFFNLLYNESMRELYPQSCAYLLSAFAGMPIVFNYLGEQEAEGQQWNQMIQNEKSSPLSYARDKTIEPVIYVTAQHTGDQLYLSLLLPYKEDMQMIQMMMQQQSQLLSLFLDTDQRSRDYDSII
ncbi:amino acid adenylation domain-containing protein [Paenibacillus sp. KACC 21273]|uniref:non-ribosomal peptide synthetase n=1 Tax=Paenibacillus sp. KACC 21273 TaxID=3025665 RepID=UPI00236698D7|nr:non-ribosomal peptide synthetase [Paenibacillus sp. KACC 21273]WDF48936.1 amino acid adenylation domain-containing protein [Paenibacillus sp. KACC 21273]